MLTIHQKHSLNGIHLFFNLSLDRCDAAIMHSLYLTTVSTSRESPGAPTPEIVLLTLRRSYSSTMLLRILLVNIELENDFRLSFNTRKPYLMSIYLSKEIYR